MAKTIIRKVALTLKKLARKVALIRKMMMSIDIGSEDNNEEGAANFEDNEYCSVDSEDDNEAKSAHSGDK